MTFVTDVKTTVCAFKESVACREQTTSTARTREREKERTLKLRNTEYIEGALNRKDDRRLLEGEQFV